MLNLLEIPSNHGKMDMFRFLLFASAVLSIYIFLVSAEEGCITREIKAKAPNIFKVVHLATPGFTISQMSLNQRHSFYMCAFGDGFGFNSSHWWVSNGCDATFALKECISKGDD